MKLPIEDKNTVVGLRARLIASRSAAARMATPYSERPFTS